MVAKKAQTGTNLSLPEIKSVAEYLCKSGFFPDAITVSAAIAKIQAGQELGVPPFAALSGFHAVNGKPAASARLMGALIKKSGEYDYDPVENSNQRASIEIWRISNPDKRFVVDFTIDDAKTAGLTTGKNGETWKKYPKAMLFARCISKAVVLHCPHVLYGAGVYVPEELEAKVDVDGDIVTVEAEVVERITDDEYKQLVDKVALVEANVGAMCQFYHVTDLRDLSSEDYRDAMQKLAAKPIKEVKDGESSTGAVSGTDSQVGSGEGKEV